MHKILDYILLPRETRELALLNKIHEAFNEKRISGEQARHLIYQNKWKYHHEKIDLLVLFTETFPTKTDKQTRVHARTNYGDA